MVGTSLRPETGLRLAPVVRVRRTTRTTLYQFADLFFAFLVCLVEV